MSRRRKAKKRNIAPDAIYNSTLVALVINRLLVKGKKTVAQQIFYQTMEKVKELTNQDPLEVLRQAVINVTPRVEIKARRLGGSTYQVPIEVKTERGTSLALRWLILAAQVRPGRSMVSKLTNEILDAFNNTGSAVRKREETHKMAEANKAFANFRF